MPFRQWTICHHKDPIGASVCLKKQRPTERILETWRTERQPCLNVADGDLLALGNVPKRPEKNALPLKGLRGVWTAAVVDHGSQRVDADP